jgi:hypothetical protein
LTQDTLLEGETKMEKVRINNFDCLLSERRKIKSIPEGYPHRYYARHGEDDWTMPLTIEKFVLVDFFGIIFVSEPLELGDDGYIEVDNFFRYSEDDVEVESQ